MKKRLMAAVAAMLMVFGTFTGVLAAEEETQEYTIVTNGDFEVQEGWGLPAEATYVGEENAYEGKGAVKLESDGNAFFTQSVYLVGGEKYDLSLFIKSDTGAMAAVKFEYYSQYAFAGDFEQRWSIGKKWTECKVSFEVPEVVVSATMLVRIWGGGNLYYDNIKIDGPISDLLIQSKDQNAPVVNPFNPEASVIKPAIGEENLFENGDMETIGDDGFPVAVDAHEGWNANKVTLETEEVHSGKYAAKIKTDDGGNPWVRAQAYDLMGGGTYQVSFWYKGTVNTPGAAFNIKLEGYTDNSMRSDNGVIQTNLIPYYTSDNWKQVVYTFTIPDNCQMVALYPRCYPQSGTLYVDDMKLYLVEMPSYFDIDTDQVFYYSDVKSGVGSISLKEYADDIGYTVDFSILDGDKVLMQSADNEFGEDKSVSYLFPVDIMSEKLKEYTFRVEIINPDGTVADTLEQDIYKCDRPTMLTKEGNFIVDGEPFYPAVLYHTGNIEETFKMAVDEGINVAQTALRATVKDNIEMLDRIHAQGMKVALMLYESNKAAGDPARIAFTKEIVAGVKDHPALFCWMTMDEPNAHYNNRAELYDILTAGYKAIREIDPVHPIYHCEASTDLYDMGLKFTDAMGIDPYPGSFFPFETHVADVTAEAEAISSKYGKGIIQILEVFTFGAASPTETQLHSMMYQSVMAGADANGYYPWKMDSPEVDGPSLDVSKWWPVITAFKDYEYDIVWKHYGKHSDTQVFDEIRTEDYWIDTWVDGADMYTVVLNRKAENQKISVPMTSGNGLIKISDFTVTPVNGDAPTTKTSAGFDVTMPAGAALLFKVTPASAVDFSRINDFGDIATYEWAIAAINEMYGQDIINDKEDYVYAPGENITRGDFAKFLIRALGLYEMETFGNNFADVAPDAEYAVEVAIGKKLGILKGVGNNEYNPETPITRQDLMVICARGMKIVKILENSDVAKLDAFSDKDLISDYAKADMATMVDLEIVRGNADGTVNPLGNTTRAEAAVIMQRIYEWNK